MSSHIPLNELDEGIQKSVENASRYLSDAKFLYRNRRYQSSILLSMLSFEEAGKALLLMDYKAKKKQITKKQWIKKFCSHQMKHLVSLRAIWLDAGFDFVVGGDVSLSRFNVDWKNVFTYADYDFENLKWTSPTIPKSFGIKDAENFSYSTMSRAAEALKCMIRRTAEFEKQEEM